MNETISVTDLLYLEVRVVEHKRISRPFAIEPAANEMATTERVRATGGQDQNQNYGVND